MVRLPTNAELKDHLKNQGQITLLNAKSRKTIDKNPFAVLESISFAEQPEKFYILKSVLPMLKHEIHIHRYANQFQLNGARLVYGFTSTSGLNTDLNFILMEKIENLTPMYLVSNEEAKDHYLTIAERLAEFHLTSKKQIKSLKNLGVTVHGIKWYQNIIAVITKKVKKLSLKMNHEYLLPLHLAEEFDASIHTINKMLIPFKKSNLILVHGDFDIGNLFLKENNNICAIDWGMGHIDNPMIDIAHLVNSLGDFDIGAKRDIFSAYFTIARKLYPKNMEMHFIRVVGTLMHILFFLNFQLYAIDNLVEANYYFEQIHTRVKHLVSILKTEF